MNAKKELNIRDHLLESDRKKKHLKEREESKIKRPTTFGGVRVSVSNLGNRNAG